MKSRLAAAAMAVVFLTAGAIQAQQRLIDRPFPSVGIWPSQPPEGCPFERSKDLVDIAFSGRYANYTNADGWYPAWADDGNLYSAWSDGDIDGEHCSSGGGKNARTAQAKIIGDDPMRLRVVNLGTSPIDATPYGGRYPCGSLVFDGVWYYGTYCLHNKAPQFAWDIMGPFVGWRYSTDFGKTWIETKHTPSKPLFPEPKEFASPVKFGPVKFGSPMFVDFGRGMEHSPDGKAYIVAQGAIEPDPKPRVGNCSWVNGDQIFLARVTPGIGTINDESQYEYFAGHNAAGNAIWTDDFEQIRPLIDWNNHCGFAAMTYNASLKKYLLAITDGKESNLSPYDSYILESDQLTGPWRLVSYMPKFGQQGYFVQLLSKFFSPDGHQGWMFYCSNWADRQHTHWPVDPPGSEYCFSLHEFRLMRSGEKWESREESNPLSGPSNIARQAKVTVSSNREGFHPEGAIDGKVGGYPGEWSEEWASDGESIGAWIRLTWDQPKTIDRVWLFDRPNTYDYITAGELTFSDGTTISVGELPDTATQGREVRFPAKTVEWVQFKVTGVKTGYPHIGLSEMGVFARQ